MTLTAALSALFAMPVLAADTIKVGAILPLTGPYAALGDDQQKGAELAAKMINAEGGVLGKQLEIVVRDSQLNGGVAVRKAKELVFEEKVDFLAGSLSGAVSKVINEFADKNKIIYMGFPQSDMVTGEDISPYGFSGMVTPFMATQAMSQFAFKNLGKKWFALTADYRWGQRLLQGWMYASEKQGGEFLGNVYAPLGTKDFSAFLPRIMAANPDFIVFNNLGRDQNAAIKQAYELGIVGKIPIVCSKTTILTMKEVYPLYDENIYGGVDFYWELADKYPTAKKFVDAFQKDYGRPPRQDGESGFHQVMALADAIKRAGTVEAEAVIKALEDGKYAFTKGEEYYQKCNHQRAETYLVLQGLGKEAKDWHVARIVEEVPAEAIMRTCEQALKDLPNADIPLPR
jgi:branched-chain amino acid transport system substrate-binding protein